MTVFLVVCYCIMAQTVTPWISSGDQSYLLSRQKDINMGDTYYTGSWVVIDPNVSYQSIDGFGYTFTEGSAEVIAQMPQKQQEALLHEIFNPHNGLGVSVVRIGIGATDLSSHSYSYDDSPGDFLLEHFSLDGPDSKWLFPLLKRAKAINPELKILATPWSAPSWMKDSSGHLAPDCYDVYAAYFVKYLKAMQDYGLPIWALTPQNEPGNRHNDPSMLMTAQEQLKFINKHLGPALSKNGLSKVRIIAFDHNCDNKEYPIYVSKNSQYVDGAAFHLYGGDISALNDYRNATGKNVYFTEQYTGSDGNFHDDFLWHIKNVVIGSLSGWSRTVLEWNLAADPEHGPHTPGGCTTCVGALTVDGESGYWRNTSYYVIGQISRFVRPGAKRIGCFSSSIPAVCMRHEDGSYALIMLNESKLPKHTTVNTGGNAFSYTLPPSSAVTFCWKEDLNALKYEGKPLGHNTPSH
ncbi:MAG: glucosylceramidase [Paludibacteraceae bacterium]|nr:glucosylceramidase [Paludibacteraceae bacterium]